jgi:hypothetical protein
MSHAKTQALAIDDLQSSLIIGIGILPRRIASFIIG